VPRCPHEERPRENKVNRNMPVDAYIILRGENARIPDRFRSLTGPHLFRSEAEKYARLIAATTGKPCCLSKIHIERILGEPVRFNERWLVANIANIQLSSIGFEADVIIGGRRYRARRSSAEDKWGVLAESGEDALKATAPVSDPQEPITGQERGPSL
jgi:hypothetical protein